MSSDGEIKEIMELLKSINDKLNASGIGLLAEADASTKFEELIKLLMEPKVIDLIHKATQLLDALSKVNPATIILLSTLIGCISPSLDIDAIANAPKATLSDLINQLNEEDTQRMIGLLINIIKQASVCMKAIQ
ncbi:hypothetical protein GCM10007981_08220 [Thermocladium modestius]|uniref:DUF1641 domain-containing protein n=1 Tax=Thermocladium modestius TaxID=62609 RepID=A0A830GST2_9CREN|nr:DUF1641 domain-containing protein [Thermocladium modestius]GGP20380.1 hypothetical protein GCM10007981_08220 [Thermocladium modestius]